jgi:hypothetical protein
MPELIKKVAEIKQQVEAKLGISSASASMSVASKKLKKVLRNKRPEMSSQNLGSF